MVCWRWSAGSEAVTRAAMEHLWAATAKGQPASAPDRAQVRPFGSRASGQSALGARSRATEAGIERRAYRRRLGEGGAPNADHVATVPSSPQPGSMVSRRDEEAAAYEAAADREGYLRSHSALPGPRGNLELIDVASAATDCIELERWAALGPDV